MYTDDFQPCQTYTYRNIALLGCSLPMQRRPSPPRTGINSCSTVRVLAALIRTDASAESAETELLAQLEWIEFFAAFFNKEGFVNTYVDATEQRIECLTAKVQAHVAARRLQGLAKPKVLWVSSLPSDASYQLSAAGTWSLGSCPSYYCDALAAAGANILNTRATLAGSSAPASFSSEKLFSAGVAGDADVIFAPVAYATPHSTCSAFWNDASVLPASVPARAYQVRRSQYMYTLPAPMGMPPAALAPSLSIDPPRSPRR